MLLGFPERMPIKETSFLDLAAIGQLHFEEWIFQRFPLCN